MFCLSYSRAQLAYATHLASKGGDDLSGRLVENNVVMDEAVGVHMAHSHAPHVVKGGVKVVTAINEH